jgi:hypothetical protein
MIIEIPVQQLESQELTVSLNGYNVAFELLVRDVNNVGNTKQYIFCNIKVDGLPYIYGAKAINSCYLNCYLFQQAQFQGYLFWWDEEDNDISLTTLTTTSHLLYSDKPLPVILPLL